MGNFNSFLHWMLNYFIIVLVSLVIIDFCCCFLLKTNFLTNFSNTLKYSLKNVVIILVLSKIITSLKILSSNIYLLRICVWRLLSWVTVKYVINIPFIKLFEDFKESDNYAFINNLWIFLSCSLVGRNISLKASNLGCTWYEWHQSDYWQSSKAF